MVKLIIAVVVAMAIVAGVGLYVGTGESTTTPTPTPTSTPAPASPSDSTPAPEPEPEPTALEPLSTEEIDFELPGTSSPAGTYEIEFTSTIDANRKVTVSITWNETFATVWRVKIQNPEGASKAWNVSGQDCDLEYITTVDGEHALRIINEKNINAHTGTMTISGSWTQTEF